MNAERQVEMLPDDPDGQARFFYLSILGIALAAGMFWRYRDRLGTALQHVAIWGLIFAGLVLAYGFKEQLLGQIAPGAAIRTGEEIAIRRGSDGHFHALVEVNGTDVKFLVDTGASGIVLTRADARRAGFDPEALSYTIPASTANGTVMGAPVRLGTMTFGGLTFTDVPAVVNEGELWISLLGLDYLDAFRSYRVEGDMLYLTP